MDNNLSVIRRENPLTQQQSTRHASSKQAEVQPLRATPAEGDSGVGAGIIGYMLGILTMVIAGYLNISLPSMERFDLSGSANLLSTTEDITDHPFPLEVSGVEPSLATIGDNSYKPLSRAIYIYVNKKSLDRPEVAAFVRYYVTNVSELAKTVGYVPLKEEEIGEQLTTLAELTQNTPKVANITGTVTVDGSSTVGPISQEAADRFSKQQLGVNVNVEISGTGGGFRKFATGSLDVTGASREIKSSEDQACQQNGVEYVRFRVALDGITVVVSQRNTWCNALTVGQLEALFRASDKDKENIDRWNELNPTWPDEPIMIYAPDKDSGTFDFFTEAILGSGNPCRTDYSDEIHDEKIQEGVVHNQFAIGYFGYAYYDKKRLLLKAVEISTQDAKEK